MKDEAGVAFTITLPSVLRPMGSWWPNGAVFPPPLAPVTWTYPPPNCHANSVLGVRPVRAERHNPWSIATVVTENSVRVWTGLFENADCSFPLAATMAMVLTIAPGLKGVGVRDSRGPRDGGSSL